MEMVRGAEAWNVWREGCVRGIRIGVLWPQGRANAQKKTARFRRQREGKRIGREEEEDKAAGEGRRVGAELI